jgi:DNA-binding MarR family transcriptional regulator
MNKDISQIETYESGIMQATAHRILGQIQSSYLSQYDLTATQWHVIGYLYQAGTDGIRLTDLMNKLDTSMPFITNTVNLLNSKGILQKVTHTDDNRVKIARLNPEYRSTVEEIEEGLREELRSRLYADSGITRQELSAYIAVLYKIAQKNK